LDTTTAAVYAPIETTTAYSAPIQETPAPAYVAPIQEAAPAYSAPIQETAAPAYVETTTAYVAPIQETPAPAYVAPIQETPAPAYVAPIETTTFQLDTTTLPVTAAYVAPIQEPAPTVAYGGASPAAPETTAAPIVIQPPPFTPSTFIGLPPPRHQTLKSAILPALKHSGSY